MVATSEKRKRLAYGQRGATGECEDRRMEFDGEDQTVDDDGNLLLVSEVPNLSLLFFSCFSNL